SVALLGDSEPRVRFFAALAAGRSKAPGAVPALAKILRETGESDTDLRHAAVMGLLGCASFPELERLAADPSPDVRMGALLVMRRSQDRSIARFLADPEPRLVLEAARAIHDLPIEGTLGALAELRPTAEQLKKVGERALERRVLNAAYRMGKADVLASHAERADLSVESRVEALDLLARWEHPSPRDRVTNEWRPLAPRTLESLPAIAARLATGAMSAAPDPVLAAFERFAGAAQAREVSGALAGWVTDAKRGVEVRTAALAALETMKADNLVATVRAALADTDGRVRASALERLERIDPLTALNLCASFASEGEIAERRAAYGILGRQGGNKAVDVLVLELERLLENLVPAELALDLLQACEMQHDARIAEMLETHRQMNSADPDVGPYLDALFGGDAQLGQAVFERVDLSCTRCHAWWPDAAERVGPNLSGVGARLTRLQILESILTPNRRTTPGFGARAFFLRDGRVVSGRVSEETDTLVRLFDASNNPVALERAEIEEERADLSAMPEDLAKSITPAEMRDLLEYLAGI
ncbi:MAG TPA: hypothetical protein VFC77_01445, partial [Myxococcota bacterium]|nr:hypothetical protein [Myxococcota bacterium]